MFRTLSLVFCLVAVDNALRTATHQLEISDFSVPLAVEKDSDAQLVCSHDGQEKFSIVKWFWSPEGPDSRRQIYQRLFGGEQQILRPHDAPPFNITFVEDKHDLMLWNLQPEHSGSFECQVEERRVNSQERKSSSYMVVYSIGDGPQLRIEGGDELEVTCEAFGVAPEPDVFITYDSNTVNTTLVVGPKKGLYNVSTNATLSRQELEGVEISCSLSFADDDIPTTEVMVVSQIYHSDAWLATTTDAPEETTEAPAALETPRKPNSGRRADAACALAMAALVTFLRALI